MKINYKILSGVLGAIALVGGYLFLQPRTATATILANLDPQKTVYVVSSGGSSSGDCKQPSPCTYSRAQNVAQNGWTIVLEPGTYSSFSVSKNGVTVVGKQGTIVDANNTWMGVAVPPGTSNVRIVGITVIRARSHGIHIQGNGVIVEENIVTNSILENATVVNGVIAQCNNGGWGSGIKVAVGGTNIIIRGNTVYENCGEGIASTRGINVLIENNDVHSNFSVEVYVDNSNGVVVRGNEIYGNNSRFYRNGRSATAILLGKESYSGWGDQMGSVIIEFNWIRDKGAGHGVGWYSQLGGGCPNCIIRYNGFTNIVTPHIRSGMPSNVFVTGNVAGTPPPYTTASPNPVTPSVTSSRTSTSTASPTRTPTMSPTITRTPTVISTSTSTGTPPFTITPTISPSVTPTLAGTPTICASPRLIAWGNNFSVWLCE
jgi:hypothetical protein